MFWRVESNWEIRRDRREGNGAEIPIAGINSSIPHKTWTCSPLHKKTTLRKKDQTEMREWLSLLSSPNAEPAIKVKAVQKLLVWVRQNIYKLGVLTR